MTTFEKEFFRPLEFTEEQIGKYFRSAVRDFGIAKKDNFTEVRFSFAYQSLIKAGIALLAKKGGVRVRSIPGHHVKILEKMSQLLQDEDILIIGDAMRSKRNYDFYHGGDFLITEKEADDYLKFVQKVIEQIKSVL